MAKIQIKKLLKQFDGGVKAVDNVDLTVEEGEFLCLLGPSGCGKTTTLRCIAGLEEPTSGEIWIGTDCVFKPGRTVPPEQRGIGMIFQSYAVWPHMTVYKNVSFGLELKNVPKAEIKQRVQEVLDLVGLGHLGHRYATDLSGGQQQRVAVARSVVLRPRVLLFDEPLSNLDAKLREHMRFELRRLQKSLGITAVYVTHDQAEAMAIADRIVIMNNGHIIQSGSPEDLYMRPVDPFVAGFIGMTNLVHGNVLEKSSDGQTMVVKTDSGVQIHCPAVAKIANGNRVLMSIRPEAIQLMPDDGETGVNTWSGTVKEIVFLGNTIELYGDLGGLDLRVQTNSGVQREWSTLKEKAKFHVPPDQVIVIPESAADEVVLAKLQQ